MLLFNLISSSIIIWLAHLLLLAGIALYVLGTFAAAYKAAVRTLAVVLIVAGAFLEGNLYGTKGYMARVADLQEQIKQAESKSAEVNTVIQTKFIDRVRVVRENTNDNIRIVENVVTQYDNSCSLSNAAISVHDSASQNVVAPSSGPAVEGTSNVKASDLIRTVTENYSTYYEVREQLLGWQQWYREQRKIHDSVK